MSNDTATAAVSAAELDDMAKEEDDAMRATARARLAVRDRIAAFLKEHP